MPRRSIANTTAASLMLCGAGLALAPPAQAQALTLPTIVRGDNLAVSGLKGSTRHIFHFDCSGHRLTADIQLKQE